LIAGIHQNGRVGGRGCQAKHDSPALPVGSIAPNPKEQPGAVPLQLPSIHATLRGASVSTVVDFAILKKDGIQDTAAFEVVGCLAARLRQYLDKDETQQQIRQRHVLGASSAEIQEVILAGAIELGFQTARNSREANHLFSRSCCL
jgi:hypothetical protein